MKEEQICNYLTDRLTNDWQIIVRRVIFWADGRGYAGQELKGTLYEPNYHYNGHNNS